MIPTVNDILLDLVAGKVPHSQALSLIEQHIELARTSSNAANDVMVTDAEAADFAAQLIEERRVNYTAAALTGLLSREQNKYNFDEIVDLSKSIGSRAAAE